MNLVQVICSTGFLVLLCSDHATSQSEDEKKFAQMLIGLYRRVNDGFNSSISESRLRYKKFPNAGFGNSITFTYQERNGQTVVRESILKLGFSLGEFNLEQYTFKPGYNINTAANQITSERLNFAGSDCTKEFSLQGSTYRGTYPACGFPRLPNGKPMVLNVSLNCTHYHLSFGGLSATYTPDRRYDVPSDIAPSSPLCPASSG